MNIRPGTRHTPAWSAPTRTALASGILAACALALTLTLAGCATTQAAGGSPVQSQHTQEPAPHEAAPAGTHKGDATQGGGTGQKGSAAQKGGTPQQEAQPKAVGMPNPFNDTTTLAAACSQAGFQLTLPTDVGVPHTGILYRAIDGDMVEVIYSGPDGEELRIRKAFSDLDISGDYNAYPEDRMVNDAGINVLLRGEPGGYKVASWVSGDYAFAILSAHGLPQDAMLRLVQATY